MRAGGNVHLTPNQWELCLDRLIGGPGYGIAAGFEVDRIAVGIVPDAPEAVQRRIDCRPRERDHGIGAVHFPFEIQLTRRRRITGDNAVPIILVETDVEISLGVEVARSRL